jgi:hypothetical protein
MLTPLTLPSSIALGASGNVTDELLALSASKTAPSTGAGELARSLCAFATHERRKNAEMITARKVREKTLFVRLGVLIN